MYTLAAHGLHWLVLGGKKVWHPCLISSVVNTLPNLQTDEAVVGMALYCEQVRRMASLQNG